MRCFQHVGTAVLAVTLTVWGQEKGSEYPNALADAAVASDSAPLFPFRITHGLADSITNVQTWTGPWKPAGQEGFVKAVNAQFVNDRGPCYFTGTNICFGGGFPAHKKTEQVAADVDRFGINLVRLHYVHHKFPPPTRSVPRPIPSSSPFRSRSSTTCSAN